MMEELMKGLAEQGFPVMISIYLLIRFESKIEALENSIIDLNTEIQKLCVRNSEH